MSGEAERVSSSDVKSTLDDQASVSRREDAIVDANSSGPVTAERVTKVSGRHALLEAMIDHVPDLIYAKDRKGASCSPIGPSSQTTDFLLSKNLSV